MPATKPTKTAVRGAAAIDPKECTPLELAALKIAAKPAEKGRDRLAVGTGQPVDLTVRIRGAIDVGGNQSSTGRATLGAERILALVFAAMGPRKMADVVEHVHAACTAYKARGLEPEIERELVEKAEDLMKTISHETTNQRRGAVTGSLSVEVVKRS